MDSWDGKNLAAVLKPCAICGMKYYMGPEIQVCVRCRDKEEKVPRVDGHS